MCEGVRVRVRMGGWAIAVHGGAGVDPNLPLDRQEQAKQLLTRCLNLGISALRSDLPAIDVVELVVRPPLPHSLNNVTYYYYSAFNLSVNKPPGLNEIVPQPPFFFCFRVFRYTLRLNLSSWNWFLCLCWKTEEYV